MSAELLVIGSRSIFKSSEIAWPRNMQPSFISTFDVYLSPLLSCLSVHLVCKVWSTLCTVHISDNHIPQVMHFQMTSRLTTPRTWSYSGCNPPPCLWQGVVQTCLICLIGAEQICNVLLKVQTIYRYSWGKTFTMEDLSVKFVSCFIYGSIVLTLNKYVHISVLKTADPSDFPTRAPFQTSLRNHVTLHKYLTLETTVITQQ